MGRTVPEPINPFYVDFEPLRRRRRYLDINATDLARAVGVHYTTIYRLERNLNKSPTVPLLVAVARALGVPMHLLFVVHEGTK